MAPRKKLKMSGETKFGIQHFFDRHASSQSLNPNSQFPTPDTQTETSSSCHKEKKEEEKKNVTPDSTKSASRLQKQHRFTFSPGMLIKQSQEYDGAGDEVTWKVSPVNQRLHSLHNPIRPCSLSSKSMPRPPLQSRCSSNVPDSPRNTNPVPTSDSFPCSRPPHHSPFTTPPSLSHSNSGLATVQACEASDQLPRQHHKKALIELLDQVEDALSCEDSESSDTGTLPLQFADINGKQMPQKTQLFIEDAHGPVVKVPESSANQTFLVLEVSDKHRPAVSSEVHCPYKVLRLLNEQSGEERVVYLWDEWFYTVVAPGDTVNVIGGFDDQGKCNVDRSNNLLIVHPDILVSGTRVAASFVCPRRSVLDERLKSNDNSTAALAGTLLHQVFQAGLMEENPTTKFLEEFSSVLVNKNIESLYTCGVHESDMMNTLVQAIPKMLRWITLHKDTPDSAKPVVDFGSDIGSKKLNICEVLDIEEMAWAPKYGLKGMIDASVRVRMETNDNGTEETILPLEFKSGKVPNGQSSMEHCAQVILYTILMSERYLKKIESGLLCYLQSDQTQGIAVRRSDVVGLIMRRNELANDILRASTMQQLPPMLQSPSICRGCRHLDVCTIYHKVHGGIVETSGLGDAFESLVRHLTPAHYAFLKHWEWLVDLEAKGAQLAKSKIWHPNNLVTDKSATSLSSVVLDTSSGFLHPRSPRSDKYIYRFVHQSLPPCHLQASDGDSPNASSPRSNGLDFNLKRGDYVILSTKSGHQSVASGVVTDISHSHVSVAFSKHLRLPGSESPSEPNNLCHEVWRIDKDEALTSFSIMRFNLVCLFLPSPQSSHLRKMIVDLEAPRFDSGCIFSQDPAISYIWSVKSLNGDQRRSILKILTAKDYALILGMPGTGKTSTMVHVVKALLIRGASILLTSYTNSAVDNLLIKLKAQGIDFLRIGRREAIHEEIQAHCFSAMDVHSVDEIKSRFDQVKVVAVTCLGMISPLLANKMFDVCIMDEAGQITLPISLGPLMHSSMFVLVGDHYQLPPLVQSTEAREHGMGVSLFCRLSEAHPEAISALQSQYRMCQSIMELSNALIYGDRLRCGSSDIANAKLKYLRSEVSYPWLMEVLNPSRPVIFMNTDILQAFEAKESKAVNNPIEAYLVGEVAKELIQRGIEGEDIGVITPYNSQANLIRAVLHMTSIEIHTIDKYQGRDKDCILVSFVRSSENPTSCVSSLLGDWHRINVALTRAKKKLIMVGSSSTLSRVPLLKLLIEKVEEQLGVVNLSRDDIRLEGGNHPN